MFLSLHLILSCEWTFHSYNGMYKLHISLELCMSYTADILALYFPISLLHSLFLSFTLAISISRLLSILPLWPTLHAHGNAKRYLPLMESESPSKMASDIDERILATEDWCTLQSDYTAPPAPKLRRLTAPPAPKVRRINILRRNVVSHTNIYYSHKISPWTNSHFFSDYASSKKYWSKSFIKNITTFLNI